MIFESENGKRILNPTKQQVINALEELDGVGNSYSLLEDDNQTYIQVGGGPVEFTVEVRKTNIDGSFTHWKAECFHSNVDIKKSIIISGSPVHIMANQVFDLHLVKKVFEAFMDGDYLPKIVQWIDITNIFN